jgi:hypothetical protein
MVMILSTDHFQSHLSPAFLPFPRPEQSWNFLPSLLPSPCHQKRAFQICECCDCCCCEREKKKRQWPQKHPKQPYGRWANQTPSSRVDASKEHRSNCSPLLAWKQGAARGIPCERTVCRCRNERTQCCVWCNEKGEKRVENASIQGTTTMTLFL